MKVFMVGGTGLIGAETAKQLIAMGHSVTTVALPPLPDGADIPSSMNIHFGDINKMTDKQILDLMHDCKGFVFAGGVDERIEFTPPVYEVYQKYNIFPVKRLLELAKQAGISKSVVLGSYFTHFARIWHKLNLTEHHPYIKSRAEQARTAISFEDSNMTVAVLELPYIFGAQKGRKPVWTMLADLVENSGKNIYFPKGGTAMITTKQAGQAVVGALINNIRSKSYPVGWENKTWKEMLTIVKDEMGQGHKKIKTIPTFLYKIHAKKSLKEYAEKNIEPGLHPVQFANLMTRKTYIDKSIAQKELGVQEDDINKAIRHSIAYCMDIKKNNKHVVTMKTE